MLGGWQASGDELTPDAGVTTEAVAGDTSATTTSLPAADSAPADAPAVQATAAEPEPAPTIPDWITPELLAAESGPAPPPPNRIAAAEAPPPPTPAPAPSPDPAPAPAAIPDSPARPSPEPAPTTTVAPAPAPSPTPGPDAPATPGATPSAEPSTPAGPDAQSPSGDGSPPSSVGEPGSTGSEFEPFLPSDDSGPHVDHTDEEARSLENFVYVPRSGPSSTAALIEALRPLQDAGMTAQDAFQLGFGRFPVGGPAHWSDDWLAPRSGGRQHHGNDIFSAFDIPVRAPADGILSYTDGGLGGKGAYVTEADGTFYYLAHLNAFVPGLGNGSRVTQGQVIAFNGDTGNARGGAPHVHFEIHPDGGSAVNPKESLDTWVADAIAAAPDLVAQHRPEQPRMALAAALTRHLDQSSLAEPTPPDAALLASSVSPGATELGWVGRVDDQRAAAARWEEWQLAASLSRSLLDPLTPAPLALVIDDGVIDEAPISTIE